MKKSKEARKFIKETRSSIEKWMTVFAVIITIGAAALFTYVALHTDNNKKAVNLLMRVLEIGEHDSGFILMCGKYLILIVAAFFVVQILWKHFLHIGKSLMNDVEFPLDDYPEIKDFYKDTCNKLGLNPQPKIFITFSEEEEVHGVRIKPVHSVSINNDATVVAIENDRQDAFKFMLAHELAHIAMNHYSTWALVITLWGRIIPIFKSVYYQSMDLSADTLAYKLTNEEAALGGIEVGAQLYAFPHMDQEVFTKGPRKNITKIERVSAFVNDITTDEALPQKRIWTIQDLAKKDKENKAEE